MDETASRRFLDESIIRIKRMAPQLGILETEIVVDASDIFVPFQSSKLNRRFMLRVWVDGEYPINPADYVFVNPESRKEEGIPYWPNDGGQAFKLENPPWLCMAGTRAWVQKGGHPNPGTKFNLIENVLFSIFAKLSKVVE
jgi:hypothetical protein